MHSPIRSECLGPGAQRLVPLVSQIARNLEHASDPDQGTCEHIKAFWDPRMIPGPPSVDTAELRPIAAAAVQQVARARSPKAT